jgi:hypothetical protein
MVMSTPLLWHLVLAVSALLATASSCALGFTTKPQGHGHGLVDAMESCKFNSTPMTIQSEIGKGTIVSFDLHTVAQPAS